MVNSGFYNPVLFHLSGWMILASVLFSCGSSESEPITPKIQPLTESVYASGIVKARDQYEAFTSANGPIQEIFVEEGDTVKAGTPILMIYSEAEKLRRENALLARDFADQQANQTRLRDAELAIGLAKSKLHNDSLLWVRTKNLWAKGIGTEVDLEQKELNYKNSQTSYQSALLRQRDLKREIAYNSESADKSLAISQVMENDYILRSALDGVVFSILKEKGEMVSPQTLLAVLGRAGDFFLEMQVDEYDIARVQLGQRTMVTMDSFKEEVFEGKVTKIYPIMDSKSKTFTVEAEFTKAPPTLFPNLTLEANIITQSKENALIVPRNYVLKDQWVITAEEDTIPVRLGIKTYEYAEILEGITASTQLILPGK
jgi:HlyD family secretion protein